MTAKGQNASNVQKNQKTQARTFHTILSIEGFAQAFDENFFVTFGGNFLEGSKSCKAAGEGPCFGQVEGCYSRLLHADIYGCIK